MRCACRTSGSKNPDHSLLTSGESIFAHFSKIKSRASFFCFSDSIFLESSSPSSSSSSIISPSSPSSSRFAARYMLGWHTSHPQFSACVANGFDRGVVVDLFLVEPLTFLDALCRNAHLSPNLHPACDTNCVHSTLLSPCTYPHWSPFVHWPCRQNKQGRWVLLEVSSFRRLFVLPSLPLECGPSRAPG